MEDRELNKASFKYRWGEQSAETLMDLCAVCVVEGRHQVRDLFCHRKRQVQSQHLLHIQVRDGVEGEIYLYASLGYCNNARACAPSSAEGAGVSRHFFGIHIAH